MPAILLFALSLAATPGLGTLGQVSFPVTGSEASQAHFQKGLLNLHSFMYDEALTEFRKATQAEPAFAMGRWGEAMALNHPVWNEQETDEGRTALAALRDLASITPLEREWVEAAKVLYSSPGTKQDRDRAYAAAMDRMRAAHPDDLEVEVFDALAKLGVSVSMADSVRLRMEAGALALDAYAKNPEHPGAAHYAIHAFDDPDHAILALPAARHYASIAPSAAHALHMPAHIFVQLGMWPEAMASCQAAVDASVATSLARGKGRWLRENHSGHWLMSLHLEQGAPRAALEELERIGEGIPHTRNARPRAGYTRAVLGYLLETGRYDQTAELLAPLDAPLLPDAPAAPAATAGSSPRFEPPFAAFAREARSQVLAYAALANHDGATATRQADSIHAQIPGLSDPLDQKGVEDDELVLRASIAAAGGHTDEAIADLRKAIELEKTLPPPSGPADGQSTWEQLGEVLLAARKLDDATAAFDRALLQHPGRARSLLGAARAAAARGDRAAAAAIYARVLAIWGHAEPGWPGLAEAKAAGSTVSAR